MPRHFNSDAALAARQHLHPRKTQLRAQKADQNGNDYRAVHRHLSLRRQASWRHANCLPGNAKRSLRAVPRRAGRGFIRRPSFPPETHAEPLAEAVTLLAPHAYRTRQTPMNPDISPDPLLAVRPPLGTRNLPYAIEKAAKNGNHHRQER